MAGRLAGGLASSVSAVTLIWLSRALPKPAAGEAPAVLRVDEFALSRGPPHGTLSVDVPTRCPVDVLPERSGCYTDGPACGAPLAVQVADR